ncbi:hypothetical protein D3C75_938470 [compost metagenome]
MLDAEVLSDLIGDRPVFDHMNHGGCSAGALDIGLEFFIGLGADRAGGAVLEQQLFTRLCKVLMQFVDTVNLCYGHWNPS